jgi:hypothetical protein
MKKEEVEKQNMDLLRIYKILKILNNETCLRRPVKTKFYVSLDKIYFSFTK